MSGRIGARSKSSVETLPSLSSQLALPHLPKGSATTANAVTEALRNGPLFRFTGFWVQRVQGTRPVQS